ncbi:MAG: hypothetical protein J5965_09135 [Aeriscardovia sp.]|nr:hypothetical protein [Aeriscardovia sp.]MBP3212834.1 hypothetical protein [Prevotella sp.]
MTNTELDNLNQAISIQFHDAYECDIVKKIIFGDNKHHDNNILSISPKALSLLKKLGWFRKFKNAVKQADLKIFFDNKGNANVYTNVKK